MTLQLIESVDIPLLQLQYKGHSAYKVVVKSQLCPAFSLVFFPRFFRPEARFVTNIVRTTIRTTQDLIVLQVLPLLKVFFVGTLKINENVGNLPCLEDYQFFRLFNAISPLVMHSDDL